MVCGMAMQENFEVHDFLTSLFTEVNENFKAYNLFMHRHTPEIEQEMGKAAGGEASVIFTFVLSSLSIDSHTFERLMLLFDPQAMWAYESRASGRIAFWDEYLMQIIQDNIILGAGLGGLEPYLFNLTGHYIHSHHLYLEIVLTFGMLGTILFIKFLFDLYTNTNKIEKMVFWSFWGPFNALHSVFDFYWATMMFFSLMIVLLSKQWRLQSEYKI